MSPGTGRAGAAFPGKSGIIARSAAWRKGREGGARGGERRQKNATRPRIGLERSASRLCLWEAQIWIGFRLAGRGDPLQIQKVMQQKKIFVKMRHGRKYLCLAKVFPGSGGTVRKACAGLGGAAGKAHFRSGYGGGDKKCGSSRELPQMESAARGMVPPIVAAIMGRDRLVVPVAGFRAGRHMGRRRGLTGLDPVRRWRRLPVMARRWRVVIPGVIVMHTACSQDEEPGEQDQGQDMQEPDKSGMCTHRHSLVPSRIASPAKEQKRPWA